MASPSPTELARSLQKELLVLRTEFSTLKDMIDEVELQRLRERLAVIEDRVGELKKQKDEADKRHWQFVYIFAGAMASLLVTVIVQLVMVLLKKP